MKYLRFVDDVGKHLAVEHGAEYAVVPSYNDLINALEDRVDLVELGKFAITEGVIANLHPSDIIAPLDPPTMRDSMCFHEHIGNCRPGEFDQKHRQVPAFYLSNPNAVLGPYDDVSISPGSKQFDYELEVCAVIGQPCSNVPHEQASDYIAGYTMYIDWSARDLQMREMAFGLGPGKGKDSATTIGPKFVTADEFQCLATDKGFDICMTASINRRRIATGNWKTIDWSFADVVAYTSRGTSLAPGDVLGSGTVGWGCLLEFFRSAPDKFPGWLKPGDVVEMSVDLIGTTRQVIRESMPFYPLSSGF